MFGRATLDGVEPRHAVLELLVPQDLSHSVAKLSTVVSSGTADLLLLDANRCKTFNDADANKNTAVLLPGGSVTLGSVTVTFVSQDANGDRVRVLR
jgi:hypothetical protein